MKYWFKTVAVGIAGGLLGGALCLIVLALAYNNSEVFGNVADWVSGIGSVVAIYLVYRQIKQQTDQHNEEKGHDFKIIIGWDLIRDKSSEGSMVSSEMKKNLFFYGTNSGMMPSAFIYIGITNQKNYKLLKSNHEIAIETGVQPQDPEISSLQTEFDIGIKKRQFERVLPGDVSKQINIPYSEIEAHFKSETGDLYIIYMSVLGEIYGRPF